MEMNNKALTGLRTLSLGDVERYRSAVEAATRVGWQHYFPFMVCFSRDSLPQILIGEEAGSLCIYLLMKEDGIVKLFLYFLPMPMSMPALRRAVQRVQEFNSSRNAIIFWVDGEDMDKFNTIPTNKIIPLDLEYMYSPSAFKSMAGSKTRDFRYNLARIQARDDVQIRPYTADDAAACLKVLADWTELQSSKYAYIRGHDYTKACLRLAPQFNPRDLFGLVILVDGEIRSFGFGGEIRTGLGNKFITKSDHRIKGINHLLNYHLVIAMDACELVNSSTANGPGVRYAKEALCPVSMHPMFRVHLK